MSARNRSFWQVGAGAAALVILAGSGTFARSAGSPIDTVAVFPIENLTADAIPAAAIRQSLTGRLSDAGLTVLADDALESFMARHRVRYSSGIDTATAELLKAETGVDAVVVASVELSSETAPPKVALFVRLVSLTPAPTVVWTADAGSSGDDAPGLFDLGLVNDYDQLLGRTLTRLGDSLASYLRTGRPTREGKCPSRFRPRSFHRNLALEPGRVYSIAVVPFFNLSPRRHAGDIMALHFIRHLSAYPEITVVDSGAVRGQLLNARVIMEGGLSIGDASVVASLVQTDFILAGRVIRYDDYDGPSGSTSVEFSTALIDGRSRKVVWSSSSYNEGGDSMGFFQSGASKTAHAMGTQMARLTTELITGRSR